MALKDWKKIRNIPKDESVVSVTGYENKNDRHRIFLLTLAKERPNRFHFRPSLISQHRQFKTKKQLLLHAKAYMRKY